MDADTGKFSLEINGLILVAFWWLLRGGLGVVLLSVVHHHFTVVPKDSRLGEGSLCSVVGIVAVLFAGRFVLGDGIVQRGVCMDGLGMVIGGVVCTTGRMGDHGMVIFGAYPIVCGIAVVAFYSVWLVVVPSAKAKGGEVVARIFAVVCRIATGGSTGTAWVCAQRHPKEAPGIYSRTGQFKTAGNNPNGQLGGAGKGISSGPQALWMAGLSKAGSEFKTILLGTN